MATKTSKSRPYLLTQFYSPCPDDVHIASIKPESFSAFSEALFLLPDQEKFFLNGITITQRISANSLFELDMSGLIQKNNIKQYGYFGIHSKTGNFRDLSNLLHPVNVYGKDYIANEKKKASYVDIFRKKNANIILFVNNNFAYEFEEYAPDSVLAAPDTASWSNILEIIPGDFIKNLLKTNPHSLDIKIHGKTAFVVKDRKKINIEDSFSCKFYTDVSVTLRTYSTKFYGGISPDKMIVLKNSESYMMVHEYGSITLGWKDKPIRASVFEYIYEID